MTVIHPNPTGSYTWEGDGSTYQQVDDRMGQSFLGGGGLLSAISVVFGNDEGTSCNGDWAIRVYKAGGTALASVPDAWAASTAYGVNDYVRPTSTGNGDVHYYFRCTVAGTSGGTEPTWPGGTGVPWQSVSEGATTVDNTVTWEVVYPHYPLDMTDPDNPAMPADDADTPTPGWLAESGWSTYNPGANETAIVRTATFSGANQIRLEDGVWYVAIIQWRPTTGVYENTITQQTASLASATLTGNCYLDGFNDTNNGPRLIDDGYIRVSEIYTLLDKTSGTDAGFANTVTGGDTDPFNSGEKISYTVQAGDALIDGITYRWQARVKDPAGTDSWSSYTTARTFTVNLPTGGIVGPLVGSRLVKAGILQRRLIGA